MDRQWWRVYYEEAARVFAGEMVAPIAAAHDRVKHVKFRACRNSGEGAIALAANWGARSIIMLGYDCQHTGGRAHWHPDHPGLGNAKGAEKWPEQFRKLAIFLGPSIRVVNASRATALKVWPRISLEEALGERDRFAGSQGAAARCA
jgi:hypothetical protein